MHGSFTCPNVLVFSRSIFGLLPHCICILIKEYRLWNSKNWIVIASILPPFGRILPILIFTFDFWKPEPFMLNNAVHWYLSHKSVNRTIQQWMGSLVFSLVSSAVSCLLSNKYEHMTNDGMSIWVLLFIYMLFVLVYYCYVTN